MQEHSYSELEERALPSEVKDAVKKLEMRDVIHAEIQKMREEGKALTLTDEEFSMLESFRRFKLRMRKNGEVFSWQTAKPEGVQLAAETANVVHPAEARLQDAEIRLHDALPLAAINGPL